MKQKDSKNKVFVGTIGHVDADKTTLTETINRYLQIDSKSTNNKKPMVRKRTHGKKGK